VHVRSRPGFRAVIDPRSAQPARYLAALAAQALQHGLPARRRLGPVLAPLARLGLPEAAVAVAARRLPLPRHPHPELDGLLAEIATRWSDLAAASDRLPRECPPLSALALERGQARTVFLFGPSDYPLLVAKLPGDVEALENEARALTEAERAALAPRALGRFGEAYVQEGLPGRPLRVAPLTPEAAARLTWSDSHRQLGVGLVGLAETTAKRETPREFHDLLEPELERSPLSASARRAASAAWRDVRRLEIAVLRHRDTSPQNCLFEGGRLAGLVDWISARTAGAPGFDTWNAAVAFLEHGAGLRRWSEERVVAVFRAAQEGAPFWREATLAARAGAAAAEVPTAMLDSLEIAFFARRLISRIVDPGRFPTGPRAAAMMLEIVCAR
jgi:hypothetical protein